MNDIALRLQELVKKTGLSYRELSDQTGIAKSAIQRYVVGETEKIPLDRLELLAKALGVSAAYLMGWEDKEFQPLPANLRPMSAMPRHRVRKLGRIAAGVPILAEEDYGIYVDAPEKADYALEIEGDSMEPDYLDGDTIYIRQQPDVHDGGVAVVLVDDSATLKRVYHLRDGLQLVSNNPKYPPMRVSLDEHDAIRILGIVVGYTRMYRSRT